MTDTITYEKKKKSELFKYFLYFKKSKTFLCISLMSTSSLLILLFSGANLGPPVKPHQLEDSYSPYNLMSTSESPTSPLAPPDSWGQGKSSSDKMANGTNINWPPG